MAATGISPAGTEGGFIANARRRGRTKDKDSAPSAGAAAGEAGEKPRQLSSRRNWLSVSGSVRARSRRPVSQPPPDASDKRRSIMAGGNVGDLFKGLRDAMSRDKLNVEPTAATDDASAVAVDGSGDSAAATAAAGADTAGEKAAAASATPAATAAVGSTSSGASHHHHHHHHHHSGKDETPTKSKDKDKDKDKGGIGRRKSGRKGKARKEQQSPVRAADGRGETPERQCRVM